MLCVFEPHQHNVLFFFYRFLCAFSIATVISLICGSLSTAWHCIVGLKNISNSVYIMQLNSSSVYSIKQYWVCIDTNNDEIEVSLYP